MSNAKETVVHEPISSHEESVAHDKSQRACMFYGEYLSDEELLEARRAERRLKWKIDLVILPLLSTIYFLSQMGRSDLGNAQTAGMGKDLGLSANQYSNAASMFVVGYIIFQLPGTILIRKVGANIQFGLACMGWGLVTACAVTLQNYGGLLATRVLVGCFEAFTQGTVFYLSFWYTHDELATRAAIFYSATALAGSFNGLIAYAVQVTLDGVNHWASWRWIFFVEGIVPIGWAFLVMLMLPKSPETAPAAMFSQKEKVMIIKRSRAAQNTGESKIEMKAIFRLLVDPLFWMLAILNSAQHFCVATISNFLPAILTGFGWSSTKSQLMTVIVYACAFVGILFWSRVSDKTRQRGLFVCINCAIATLGYALLLGLTDSTGRFIATCICAASVYPSVVLIVTWTMVNNPGYTQRAASSAIINMIAQCIGIAGTQAYNDPPVYRKGNAGALGLMALTTLVSLALMWVYHRRNKIKTQESDSDESNRLRAQYTVDDIGHRHPDAYFQL